MTPDIAIAAGVLGLLVLLAVPHAAKGRLLARLVRAAGVDRADGPSETNPETSVMRGLTRAVSGSKL